jgi:hypothetical protein
MSIEAMKQALESLEEIYRTGDTQAFDLCYAPNVIPALRQAIAEAEKQEPVGYVSEPGSCTEVGTNSGVLHKKWRGLQDKDLHFLWVSTAVKKINKDRYNLIAQQVEAYLRERNT